MNLKWLAHTMLHIGCVVLLLLQAHRIQQLRNFATEDRLLAEKTLESVRFFAGETRARLDSCYNALYQRKQQK
jgi:hypothetical protein